MLIGKATIMNKKHIVVETIRASCLSNQININLIYALQSSKMHIITTIVQKRANNRQRDKKHIVDRRSLLVSFLFSNGFSIFIFIILRYSYVGMTFYISLIYVTYKI